MPTRYAYDYDEDEERTGFLTMIEDNLELPFETMVLGVPVSVDRINLTDGSAQAANIRDGVPEKKMPEIRTFVCRTTFILGEHAGRPWRHQRASDQLGEPAT